MFIKCIESKSERTKLQIEAKNIDTKASLNQDFAPFCRDQGVAWLTNRGNMASSNWRLTYLQQKWTAEIQSAGGPPNFLYIELLYPISVTGIFIPADK